MIKLLKIAVKSWIKTKVRIHVRICVIASLKCLRKVIRSSLSKLLLKLQRILFPVPLLRLVVESHSTESIVEIRHSPIIYTSVCSLLLLQFGVIESSFVSPTARFHLLQSNAL